MPHCYWNVYASPPPPSTPSPSVSCFFLPRYAFVIVIAVVTLSLYSTLASPGRDRLGRAAAGRSSTGQSRRRFLLSCLFALCLDASWFLLDVNVRCFLWQRTYSNTHTPVRLPASLPAPAVLCVCPLTAIGFRASLVFFSSFHSNFSSLLHNKHYIMIATDHNKQLKCLIR